MKVYQFIVLLVLVAYINSSCSFTAPKSENDCFNATLSDEEKNAGDGYCCYMHNSGKPFWLGNSFCISYPKDYTEDRLKKDLEEWKKYGYDKLICRFDK